MGTVTPIEVARRRPGSQPIQPRDERIPPVMGTVSSLADFRLRGLARRLEILSDWRERCERDAATAFGDETFLGVADPGLVLVEDGIAQLRNWLLTFASAGQRLEVAQVEELAKLAHRVLCEVRAHQAGRAAGPGKRRKRPRSPE